MIDLRNTKIRILSPEHEKAYFDFIHSLGMGVPEPRILANYSYPYGFLNARCDNLNWSVFGIEIFDSAYRGSREITFNSKTREIEFVGGSVKSIDIDRLSQQMGYDIKETETSDGSTASYYELPDGATQLQHLISHKDMNSQIGEIFRSCYRYGQASHSDKLRDAKKIQFYINAEIERLEKLNAK